MNILLISNKGKLNNAVELKIKENNNVFLYLINKNLNFDELIIGFKKIFFNNKLDLIIFISGETRDENKMMLLNYLFPKEILRISQSNFIPLIYLSSLAVFGIPTNKKVTKFSQKNSIDLYSTTKNLFDSYARNHCVNASILSILPGSIINFNSNHDIINKLIIFSKKSPQNIFLRKFNSMGNISCIYVNDLAKSILSEVNNITDRNKDVNFKSKICTVNLSISQIQKKIYSKKYIIMIPNINFLNSKFFSKFFKKNILKKLYLFFNNIEYVSDYDFNQKSYLNRVEY